ncbi:helix-turn-helix domain-containing protein [Caldalkalibacillus salinus]|uniref:helix-turn-helix domain-containing protein n=1 Tax=Caldalkalibacillus salinus TaxID=2803787 RepID=UPI0019221E94|nr:helix-turn-helix domain-containing protein [Caldalkalibacillus salinus]
MLQQVDISQRSRSFYIHYNTHDASKVGMQRFHLHDDYEMYYLLEGKRLYLIDGKQYTVHANHMVLINKNVVHKTVTKDTPRHKRIVINFRESLLQDEDQSLLYPLFESGPNIFYIPAKRRALITQIMERLKEEYVVHDAYVQVYIRSLLVQLLVECQRILEQQNGHPSTGSSPFNVSFPHRSAMIAEIIQYINEYYSQNLSLSHLSQHFHLNEQYISRLFRQVTGCNIVAYINTVRIHQAQRLLMETNAKMTDIARLVGFKNNVHFSRVFRKCEGMSPSTYRKQNTLSQKL